MCGIVGGQGLLSTELFKAMIETIAHRGPDYLATESFDQVHLAHARLSIIDLTKESNQPLWDSERKACIVFNGEIYNYQLLREELIELGYRFVSKGDAEVLVNLYLHFGESALSRLEGIYAFAIWDVRTQTMFLARDPCGIKPLYYVEHDQGFYFSSEFKSLLLLPAVSRELDYDALFRSIVLLMSPGSATILKQVHKLEAGSYLLVKDRQVITHQRWAQLPVYSSQINGRNQASLEIDSALQASVQSQMVADVPVGAFLSGGLDSSLIVAMIKQLHGKAIECFTIQSMWGDTKKEGFIDDLPYAQRAAKLLQVPLNIVAVKPDMVSLLPKLIYHLDEPQADPAVLNVFLICELARSKGIKVLFSGAGGDDVFSGYRRHQAIVMEKYWSFLPIVVRKGLQFVARRLPKNSPHFRRISKLFSFVSQSDNERLLSYFYWIDPGVVRALFTDDIQQKLSCNPLQFMLTELEDSPEKNRLEKMLDLEKRYFLVDHNLNYTDKMSMAHGVEVRVPFLDANVLAVAAKVNAKLKHRYGRGKWILKKVAEKYLPKAIIYRKKTGFGAPLRQWMQHDLKALVDDTLSDENIIRRGLFKPEKIRALIAQDRAGEEDYCYPIYALLCFEIWCQIFIDGKVLSNQ